jgi:hypothetical protein
VLASVKCALLDVKLWIRRLEIRIVALSAALVGAASLLIFRRTTTHYIFSNACLPSHFETHRSCRRICGSAQGCCGGSVGFSLARKCSKDKHARKAGSCFGVFQLTDPLRQPAMRLCILAQCAYRLRQKCRPSQRALGCSAATNLRTNRARRPLIARPFLRNRGLLSRIGVIGPFHDRRNRATG